MCTSSNIMPSNSSPFFGIKREMIVAVSNMRKIFQIIQISKHLPEMTVTKVEIIKTTKEEEISKRGSTAAVNGMCHQ